MRIMDWSSDVCSSDLVICADVLEHVRHPEALLDDIRGRLRPGGSVIASIPNFGHWYPRARVALGRFDYDARGILDRGHVRFFTKRSFTRLVESAGGGLRRTEATGLPLAVVERGGSGYGAPPSARPNVVRLDKTAVAVRPPPFPYPLLPQ